MINLIPARRTFIRHHHHADPHNRSGINWVRGPESQFIKVNIGSFLKDLKSKYYFASLTSRFSSVRADFKLAGNTGAVTSNP
jgi:hypothetical protein